MQVLAQGVEQGGARIERQPVLGSVDVQRDVDGGEQLLDASQDPLESGRADRVGLRKGD
jgi:hypothetical protein